jgi:hypothetical protein
MTEEKAHKQAKKLVGLYANVFWYVVINIFLYFIDYTNNGRIDWAFWVTFGWGIGVISQAFGVFFSPDLEDKIAEKLMKK